MKRRSENGITLIALIITVILMLILAGVVISLTLGKNGLINTAKYAVVKTEEETAREKLELALADLQARKYTDETYDENEYINNYLRKEGMTVEGNVVLVDGWKFTIDRSVPKIGESIGQGEVKTVSITTPYVGTTSFTTKILEAYNEEKIESYTYKIDEVETKTIIQKEYTTENELEPESTHTVQVVAKYKDGKTIESNILTIKTEPRTYLYNNGDECIETSGGWKAIEVDDGANDTVVKKPTLSYDTELKCLNAQIYADSGYDLESGSVTINNKIDYSKYKSINIVYTASLTQYNAGTIIGLYKNHENVLPFPNNKIKEGLCYGTPININKTYTIVISTIKDFNSFYIYLQASQGETASINIYEVWLEK